MEGLKADIARQVRKRSHVDLDSDAHLDSESSLQEPARLTKRARHSSKPHLPHPESQPTLVFNVQWSAPSAVHSCKIVFNQERLPSSFDTSHEALIDNSPTSPSTDPQPETDADTISSEEEDEDGEEDKSVDSIKFDSRVSSDSDAPSSPFASGDDKSNSSNSGSNSDSNNTSNSTPSSPVLRSRRAAHYKKNKVSGINPYGKAALELLSYQRNTKNKFPRINPYSKLASDIFDFYGKPRMCSPSAEKPVREKSTLPKSRGSVIHNPDTDLRSRLDSLLPKMRDANKALAGEKREGRLSKRRIEEEDESDDEDEDEDEEDEESEEEEEEDANEESEEDWYAEEPDTDADTEDSKPCNERNMTEFLLQEIEKREKVGIEVVE